MAVRAIARLAARAPVPIFPLVGAGSRYRVQDLLLRNELKIAASPRHASVLLVAGHLPPSLYEATATVHDQIPPPRATALWLAGEEVSGTFAAATDLGEGDPVGPLIEIFAGLMVGQREGDEPILPDEPPVPWKGVGPHGQGGEGMMGGKPYGRPLAEMGHARDGLMLEELPLRVGPFLPGFPPGLSLDLTLRGDVVEGVSTTPNPFPRDLPHDSGFDRARQGSVPIAELELQRAEHHLRLVAEAFQVLGLTRIARGVLKTAIDPLSGASRISRIRRLLGSGLRWAARDVGPITGDVVDGKGLGWVARASGSPHDARAEDPSYLSLGFEPIVQERGDALARFEQLLDEAAQAIDLARRAADARATPGSIEGLHGINGGGASPHLLSLIPELIEGLEWADALTTIMSLGIDFEDASAVERSEVLG